MCAVVPERAARLDDEMVRYGALSRLAGWQARQRREKISVLLPEGGIECDCGGGDCLCESNGQKTSYRGFEAAMAYSRDSAGSDRRIGIH